jgi:hypothetical protein
MQRAVLAAWAHAQFIKLPRAAYSSFFAFNSPMAALISCLGSAAASYHVAAFAFCKTRSG